MCEDQRHTKTKHCLEQVLQIATQSWQDIVIDTSCIACNHAGAHPAVQTLSSILKATRPSHARPLHSAHPATLITVYVTADSNML